MGKLRYRGGVCSHKQRLNRYYFLWSLDHVSEFDLLLGMLLVKAQSSTLLGSGVLCHFYTRSMSEDEGLGRIRGIPEALVMERFWGWGEPEEAFMLSVSCERCGITALRGCWRRIWTEHSPEMPV